MMKKIIIVLLVLAVAGGSYYFGNKRGFNQGMAKAAQNFSQAKRDLATAQAPKNGPNLDSILRAIAGKWTSSTDSKTSIEFTASSTIENYISGKKVAPGVYSLFSAEKPDSDAHFTLLKGIVYMKLDDPIIDSSGPIFFKLNKITATDLELGYTEQEGTISFKRVK